MKLLERLSGLSDEDPIHRHLKVVDNFMGDHDWSYLSKMPREKLFTIVASKIGSFRDNIDKMDSEVLLEELEQYFEQNQEKVLLEILQKLRRDDIDFKGIRCVLFWLIANIDLLAERYFEGKPNRQLNNDWQPAW